MKLSSTSLALLVSLAINFILIGLFAGTMLKRGGAERAPQDRPGVTMSAEDRRVTSDILQSAYEAAAPERTAHREATEALKLILAEETLDQASAEAGFAHVQQAETAMRTKMQDILLQELYDVTPQQRRVIVRRLLRNGDRRARRGTRPRPQR